MCYEVEPEYVLASLFKTGKYKSLTSEKLFLVQSRVRESFQSSVQIELSKDALCSAVQLYPKMFRWQNDAISRSENSDEYYDDQSIESIFGWAIDASIKDELKSVLSQI